MKRILWVAAATLAVLLGGLGGCTTLGSSTDRSSAGSGVTVFGDIDAGVGRVR